MKSLALIATLLASTWLTLAAEPSARPNVLFIICDDLRPDALGCYGSKVLMGRAIKKILRFTQM
jgi:arylsulfatase A-like enzyme